MSFKIQLKIEYLLPYTGSRKVLENIPAYGMEKVKIDFINLDTDHVVSLITAGCTIMCSLIAYCIVVIFYSAHSGHRLVEPFRIYEVSRSYHDK